MLEIKLCTNCKEAIKKDIDSGYAVYQEGGRLICKECSSLKIKKEKGYEEKDFILESLLNEVKTLIEL